MPKVDVAAANVIALKCFIISQNNLSKLETSSSPQCSVSLTFSRLQADFVIIWVGKVAKMQANLSSKEFSR